MKEIIRQLEEAKNEIPALQEKWLSCMILWEGGEPATAVVSTTYHKIVLGQTLDLSKFKFLSLYGIN